MKNMEQFDHGDHRLITNTLRTVVVRKHFQHHPVCLKKILTSMRLFIGKLQSFYCNFKQISMVLSDWEANILG